ncbi:MAG: hypothetical protein LGB54_01750 [Sulfurovum sp.]|nr:hypothetical protein [Sulfurovum sp.]
MPTFKQFSSKEPISSLIKATFDIDLPVSGRWGYTQALATIINTGLENTPLHQLQHMIASMRTYLEMNITLPKEERYSSINLNEKKREIWQKEKKTYHKVTYEISAIKEDIYATFIDEYKEGYGEESFDIVSHFQQRKEMTLIRIKPHWFEVSHII